MPVINEEHKLVAFDTIDLPAEPDYRAPDGSEIRLLLRHPRGSMAAFRLPPGQVSQAVTHKTVDEIWYVVAGEGLMWRSQAGRDEVVDLVPGRCVSVPLGTAFQFRAAEGSTLDIVGVTMPPWPLDREEAVPVSNHWPPNVPE